ncbi:hypothetical protein NEMIN01_0214 [Nematocida minor]|uniref:uncharacterized protein n=1 Tax=Nematocida minor TaxID=1912983 RepID=UPI00221FD188|nr:uncharacterized protein NEMIN01_0110 [Nematocida minor]XP_051332116.1 uncharacterized protein NEMIN01_0214 [Nematocida minor]KAI5188846.1 hypothetical protein NEMIN01_0110 [Nematocida minor]KAI5188950.1 hypothetical protein NEMIN01_0214 [Nematocida minor]
MDRTKEFLLLAGAANIVQKPPIPSEDSSLITIAAIEESLNALESAVNQKKAPCKDLIDQVESFLGTLSEQHAEVDISTEISQSIAKAMQRKHTAMMLRLTSILSRHKENEQRKAALMQMEEQAKSRGPGRSPHQESGYAHREIQREEISSVRKREFESLEQHINELGRMVTEVSMHISLQGEKVEMIDGLFTKTKSNLRGGSYELRGAQEKVNQKRKTIILVFLVLFAILLIKYLRWI